MFLQIEMGRSIVNKTLNWTLADTACNLTLLKEDTALVKVGQTAFKIMLTLSEYTAP